MNEPAPLNLRQRLLQRTSLTIQHIAIAIACGLFLLLVCMWCARLSPWLEFAVHFSVHAFVATLVVIPILWLTTHRRTAGMCCIMAGCFAFFVQPWLLVPLANKSAIATDAHQLRVLSWNVLATNEEFDAVVAFIRKVDPDVLVLIEVRPDLLGRAPWLAEHFPISKVLPNWGGGGIAVFSRTANTEYLVEFDVKNFETRVMPSIVATFTSTTSDRHVDLIATHTFSPIPPKRAIVRDMQLREFLNWSNDRDYPQCLVGDLNTTPWTSGFWALERAGFRDSRRGAGNCASWPSWLGAAGIPIDHALTRGDCTITERKVHTADAGSDHRPIEFLLSF